MSRQAEGYRQGTEKQKNPDSLSPNATAAMFTRTGFLPYAGWASGIGVLARTIDTAE
jgi:hypothetical protein